MTKPLKLIAIGNSTGVILPKDVLAHLRVSQGDVLGVSTTADGVELKPYEPDFEEQVEAARAVMKRRFSALRELAK